MKYVPCLGPDGWVPNGKKKLDLLVSHIYASDFSQTFLFPGEVSSMSKLVKEHQGRLNNARSAIADMLTTYFNKYYKKVEVNVYIYDKDDFHAGELVLSARLTDHDDSVNELHEVMTDKGSLTRRILDYDPQ